MAKKRKLSSSTELQSQSQRQGPSSDSEPLLSDLRELIQETRAGVAQTVNAALVLLYWEVGHRIQAAILHSRRAGYGKQVVTTLADRLASEFGSGFNEKNLRRMIQLAEIYPDREIVVALSRQLGWSHFLALLPLKSEERIADRLDPLRGQVRRADRIASAGSKRNPCGNIPDRTSPTSAAGAEVARGRPPGSDVFGKP